MWQWKLVVVTLSILAFSVCNVAADPDTYTLEDVLREVTTDKDNHNLVDEISHFVTVKIQEATSAVGAPGVVDPGKLQEYVTSALGMVSGWLVEKTGTLFEKIRDRVGQWWSGAPTRGVWSSKQEVTEEVRREVLKKLYARVEQELRSRNISGVTEEDLEKVVMPVIRKTFAGLFGFPVNPEKIAIEN